MRVLLVNWCLLAITSLLLLTGCVAPHATLKAVDSTGCEIREYRETDSVLEFTCARSR